MGFKKVTFLYKVKLNVLLEIGLNDLYDEANYYYREHLSGPHREDIIDMDWRVDSCDKERQTITLKITGYVEDEDEQNG